MWGKLVRGLETLSYTWGWRWRGRWGRWGRSTRSSTGIDNSTPFRAFVGTISKREWGAVLWIRERRWWRRIHCCSGCKPICKDQWCSGECSWDMICLIGGKLFVKKHARSKPRSGSVIVNSMQNTSILTGVGSHHSAVTFGESVDCVNRTRYCFCNNSPLMESITFHSPCKSHKGSIALWAGAQNSSKHKVTARQRRTLIIIIILSATVVGDQGGDRLWRQNRWSCLNCNW